MNFNKLIIARIKLLFRSVKAKRAKKKLLETFKKHPQSIRKLSAAYEKFLRAVQAEQRAVVTLKALKTQYSRRPILMKIRDIGQYTLSRRRRITQQIRRSLHYCQIFSKYNIWTSVL